MAAGVAHEINNPLTYVSANLEFSSEGLREAIDTLRRASVPGARAGAIEQTMTQLDGLRSALADASDGAERVRRIVRDLRKLARGDEQPQSELDLRKVIGDAVKLTAHAVGHHARVRLELGPVPRVTADEGGLGQVFVNLLLNACEAIRDGRADDNEIVVSTRTDAAGNAVVEVKDTGPGIEAAVLPRLFDPFFTTKPVGAGMGLGLAICHSIVGDAGGQIVAENAPPFGALFRVTLPPTGPAPEREPPIAPSPSAGSRRGRVLVIDDEPQVARVMDRILGRAHDVTVCSDGQQALAHLDRGEHFDVILCDVMMPNMSGMDVHAALLARHPAQLPRVIFTTGGAFSDQARAFLTSLPNAQVTKPFSAELLRALVQEHIDGPVVAQEGVGVLPHSDP